MKTMTNDQLRTVAPAVFADAPAGHTSNRYDFVPTYAVVDILRQAGWNPVRATQARVNKADRFGLQKHRVDFAREDTDLGAERVELALINSHDATSSFQVFAAIFRKVCGNGLMHGSNLYTFRHKHVGFDGNEMVKSAVQIGQSAGEIAREVNNYRTIELTPDERGVFAEAAHRLLYAPENHAIIKPDQLLHERRFDDKGNDLWTTYNVVQENMTKGGLRGRAATGRRAKTRKITNIDKDVALNRALWALTTRMAEIKTQ